MGGIRTVIEGRKWQAVRRALNLPQTSSSGNQLLRAWELYYGDTPDEWKPRRYRTGPLQEANAFSASYERDRIDNNNVVYVMNIKNNIFDDTFSTSPSISCAPSTMNSSHPSEREEESEDGEDGRRCHGKLGAKTFESDMEVEEEEMEVEEEEVVKVEEGEEEEEEEEEERKGRRSCMVKQQEGGENPENDDLEDSHIKVRKMKGLEVVPKAFKRIVNEMGGFHYCCEQRMWQQVRQRLGIPHSSSSGNNLIRIWKEYFGEHAADHRTSGKIKLMLLP